MKLATSVLTRSSGTLNWVVRWLMISCVERPSANLVQIFAATGLNSNKGRPPTSNMALPFGERTARAPLDSCILPTCLHFLSVPARPGDIAEIIQETRSSRTRSSTGNALVRKFSRYCSFPCGVPVILVNDTEWRFAPGWIHEAIRSQNGLRLLQQRTESLHFGRIGNNRTLACPSVPHRAKSRDFFPRRKINQQVQGKLIRVAVCILVAQKIDV